MDTRDEKITVVGTADPVAVVRVLRKLFPTAQLVSVGPAKEEKKKDGDKKAESGPPPPHEFTVGFLNRITNGFSGELIIGRGRHGVVYKVLVRTMLLLLLLHLYFDENGSHSALVLNHLYSFECQIIRDEACR